MGGCVSQLRSKFDVGFVRVARGRGVVRVSGSETVSESQPDPDWTEVGTRSR